MKFECVATEEEKLDVLFTSLCNALNWVLSYGLVLRYDNDEYEALCKNAVSFEGVLLAIVKNGGSLYFYDSESDATNVPEGEISLVTLSTNWSRVPMVHMLNFARENDDAEDADVFLQTIAFGSVVYG